jgi:hypothetical protein
MLHAYRLQGFLWGSPVLRITMRDDALSRRATCTCFMKSFSGSMCLCANLLLAGWADAVLYPYEVKRYCQEKCHGRAGCCSSTETEVAWFKEQVIALFASSPISISQRMTSCVVAIFQPNPTGMREFLVLSVSPPGSHMNWGCQAEEGPG